MSQWIVSVLVGLAGAGGLALFYTGVYHQWPEAYFGLEDSLDSVVSRSMTFYVCFRAVPVWLATVFVTVTVERLNGLPGLAAFVLGATHLSFTNVRGLVLVIRRGGNWTLRGYHVAATLALAGVVFAGYRCYSVLGAAVPQAQCGDRSPLDCAVRRDFRVLTSSVGKQRPRYSRSHQKGESRCPTRDGGKS